MARSLMNCFELEIGAPLKKIDTGMGSGGHSGLRGSGDCSSPNGGGLR